MLHYKFVLILTYILTLCTEGFAKEIVNNAIPYSRWTNIMLPNDANVVNAVFQDTNGMLWLGTKRGLFSYNGYDAHRFNTVTVQSIVQYESFHLYVGTDDGIWLFNMQTEEFDSLPDELAHIGAVRVLMLDEDTLWIGTRDKGLWSYDLKRQQLRQDKLQETMVFALEKGEGGFYVGSKEHLSFYNYDSQKRTVCFPQEMEELGLSPLKMVYSLHYEPQNKFLWIGTEKKLLRFDTRRSKVWEISAARGSTVKSMKMDVFGNLLLGTDTGLLILPSSSYSHSGDGGDLLHVEHDTHNPKSIRNNVIWDVLCDNLGNVWLGTDRGISTTQPHTNFLLMTLSEFPNSTKGNLFTTVHKDSRGELWLGGDNGLIHITQEGDGSVVTWFSADSLINPLRDNKIWHVYEDHDRDIWIATNASIARYNRQTNHFDYYVLRDSKGRNANWAYAIWEDDMRRLWVATYKGGLYIVDKQALIESGGEYMISHDLFGTDDEAVSTVYQLVPDGHGGLWLNLGNGLAHVDTKSLKVERVEACMDNMAFANNAIWFSESGMIKRYDLTTGEIKTTAFADKEGMIYTLVAEHANLWFSTAYGIYRMDTQTEEVNTVYVPDNFYKAASYDALTDEIVWAGEDCFLRYSLSPDYPYPIAPSYFHPVITSVTEKGLPVKTREGYSPRFSNEIRIFQGRDVQLELSTLDFAHVKENIFYYKLGIDDCWHSLPFGQNKIAFAAMPYGKNQLLLACTNPEIDKKSVITTYFIYVPFPWYLSVPMFVVYVVLFVLAVLLVIKGISRRNRRLYEQRTREKTLELSRQKMEFFVNMSHELKTPLTLVIAPLGALLTEKLTATMKTKLTSILENAQRLNNLISRILDINSMEYEGEDTLLRSHVELCTLLGNCIASFEGVCNERGLVIKYSSNVDSLWLNADQMKLDSVFTNLLSNAVKYVDDGNGVIRVNLLVNEEKVEVCIADNGKGMVEEDIPMMPIRFFQGKNAKQRGGTGIGFYLVKKFTEMHGGSVSIKNDHGLVVTVEIPLNGDNLITASALSIEKGTETDADSLPSVLLVDDNQEITEFLSETLSCNYRCFSACDGNKALEMLKQMKPDIMIVDQMMPNMSGLELCAHLRHNCQTATIPVIMLTVKDDIQTEMDGLKIGIDVFMSKPFDLKKLRLQIYRLLQKHEDIEKNVSLQTIANPMFAIDKRKSDDERLLEEITQLVERNMADEQFNVTTLAKMLGIDSKQLYRKINQITGLSPVAYVRSLRLKKAAVLLKEDNFTVSEVMYMVGYSNASYFTKCFTAEFGISPRQWKMEKQGEDVSKSE